MSQEAERKKWVSLSYLAVAAIVSYVLFVLAFKLVGRFDLEARVAQIDWIIRIGSVVVGAVLFAGLYVNKQANAFMDDVVLELSRVTWPTQSDTAKATWVVVIMVLIAGLLLGGLDVFWTWILKLVI